MKITITIDCPDGLSQREFLAEVQHLLGRAHDLLWDGGIGCCQSVIPHAILRDSTGKPAGKMTVED